MVGSVRHIVVGPRWLCAISTEYFYHGQSTNYLVGRVVEFGNNYYTQWDGRVIW